MAQPRFLLATIVLAQFCCTSLWFAGNGVMPDLVENFGLGEGSVGHLTSAVQFGFICGTLVFAVFSLADRFSPSRVFLVSALAGALCNLGVCWQGNTFATLLTLRFATGFFLAGIYPVGMKIAADYYREGLGKSLGFLVGALVLGTAFPHLLKGLGNSLPWRFVLAITSALAAAGGLFLWARVPDGPGRVRATGIDPSAIYRVFKNRNFRAAAFGYFGHMWELYAFWAFIPVLLGTYFEFPDQDNAVISLGSFAVIGIGGLGCVLAGYLARRLGEQRIAFSALVISGLCCLALPMVASHMPAWAFMAFLLAWGMAVTADSPMFSTLVAHRAQPEIKGTALTIVNCVGFAITIFSIQLLTALHARFDGYWIYMLLAPGPALGLWALLSGSRHSEASA